jgi:hypothetical protein
MITITLAVKHIILEVGNMNPFTLVGDDTLLLAIKDPLKKLPLLAILKLPDVENTKELFPFVPLFIIKLPLLCPRTHVEPVKLLLLKKLIFVGLLFNLLKSI